MDRFSLYVDGQEKLFLVSKFSKEQWQWEDFVAASTIPFHLIECTYTLYRYNKSTNTNFQAI